MRKSDKRTLKRQINFEPLSSNGRQLRKILIQQYLKTNEVPTSRLRFCVVKRISHFTHST